MKSKSQKTRAGFTVPLRWFILAATITICLNSAIPQAEAANDWSPRNGPEGGYVGEVAVDYTDSNLAYLSNFGGIFKTTNGGVTWTNLNAYWGASSKILLDPTNHTTVYLVSGRIIKSTDAGANWTILDTKIPCNDFVVAMVMDPKTPSTLYAIIATSATTGFDYYVIKSTDGGGTWNKLAWKAYALAIDPTNSNILYASTTSGLQTSTNGGSSWSPAGTGLPATDTLGTVVVDPKTPTTLYLTSGGKAVYKSINSGGQWQLSNTGVTGVNLKDPVIDPINSANLYLVATDSTTTFGGVYKTTNGAGQWSSLNLGISTASVQIVGLAPSNPANVYAGTFQHGVLKSSDSGTTWAAQNAGLKASIEYMALDPTDKNTIYAGVPGLGVFQSTDGGNNWISRNAGLGSQFVVAIAISPTTSKTLWVSINNASEIDLGGGVKFLVPGIYKSTDGGANWTLTTTPADDFSFYAPTKLIADPVNANGVYALGVASIYHSTDGGSTWTSSKAGLPATAVLNCLAIDPSSPATLYLGLYVSAAGTPLIYKSVDGGTTWSPSGSGLPNTQGIFDLAIDPKTPSTLYASVLTSITVNGGVFKSTNSGGSWQDTTSGIQQLITNYTGTLYGNLHYPSGFQFCSTQFLITGMNLAIDSTTPFTLFAVVNGIVLRTTDAAVTWNIASSGLPFVPYQIGVSRADHTAVYAAIQGIWVYVGSGGGGGGGGTSSLSVSSPNGGESWLIGSAQNITWSTTGTVGNVKIEFSTNGGTSYTTIIASTPNSGSYSWTVPNTPSTTVKVRISDVAGTVSATSNGNLTITASCSYALNLTSINFDSPGGIGNLNVTTSGGCAWTAASNVSWITITLGSSGNGNGTVNYSVAANSGASARTGTLTIGGQTFSVIQAGTEGNTSATLFVPILLSLSGAGGSFYTSELTLTNRGTTTAQVEFTYTAAFSTGSGTATTTLPPGQVIQTDSISYLRGLGIPIPDSGNRGGTLRVRFSNLSSSSAASITVRTATLVKDSGGNLVGRAGLAYPAISIGEALTGTAFICGLRQNSSDRSNAAFQNLGASSDGSITLQVTVFDGNSAFSQILPPVTLGPGQFFQIGNVLTSNGLSLTNGYLKVDRTSGTAPYFAYGVINDQVNSDGSFVAPQSVPTAPVAGLSLPVIVQTSTLLSELVLTNWSSQARTINFAFADTASHFTISLSPGQQQIIPDIFAYMRDHSVPGIGPAGTTIVGALFATATGGDIGGVVVGARTSFSGGAAGGRFGLFYAAIPIGHAATNSAWLFGLQQNSENRTNLAIVNTGETDGSSDTFVIDLYDGATGTIAATTEPIVLNAHQWMQKGAILTSYAPAVSQGYAQVRRTSGNNPFIAYAVINDGAGAGLLTGDGAYIGSSD